MVNIHEELLPSPPSAGVEIAKTFEELYDELRARCFEDFPTVKNVDNNAICPICEGVFSTKVTLEHIIPKGKKGKFHFAILPINLVKCCDECNTSKHQKCSTSAEDSEINPYFEKYNIVNYLKLEFKYIEDLERWGPQLIKVSQGSSTENKRIENFIDIYNIIPTYQHRINIEYNKIINTLSKQITLPLSKNTLVEFLEILKERYTENFINEEKWIDQNYFGKLICETLCQLFEDSAMVDEFYKVIEVKRLNDRSLVFKSSSFLDKLGKQCQDLNEYLDWIEEILVDNSDDFRLYYDHLKSNQVNYKLPRLGESVMPEYIYQVISSIFKLYMDEERDFADFKEKCQSIILQPQTT